MAVRTTTGLGLVGLVVLVGVGALVWRFGYFAAPFAWTGEPARLATALGLEPGMRVADVGAGSGELAVAMAGIVGPDGGVYATELAEAARTEIARRVSSAGAVNVRVVTAETHASGLAPASCDALYLRTVFHHVVDRPRFAAELARAVRPGGRIAIIDFAPGTLWFHGADHGIAPAEVEAAFVAAGWHVRERVDAWGGGLFLRVFEQ
jgi:ubiquinone/menaquinone biosynthesis C-methylase UbiE